MGPTMGTGTEPSRVSTGTSGVVSDAAGTFAPPIVASSPTARIPLGNRADVTEGPAGRMGGMITSSSLAHVRFYGTPSGAGMISKGISGAWSGVAIGKPSPGECEGSGKRGRAELTGRLVAARAAVAEVIESRAARLEVCGNRSGGRARGEGAFGVHVVGCVADGGDNAGTCD